MGRRTGGTKDVNALRNKIRIGIALAALAAIIVGLKIAGGGSGSGGTVTFTADRGCCTAGHNEPDSSGVQRHGARACVRSRG